jgi:type II secretory pathway component PulJ
MIAAVGVLGLSILLKTCSHGDIRRDEELCDSLVETMVLMERRLREAGSCIMTYQLVPMVAGKFEHYLFDVSFMLSFIVDALS